MSSQAWISDLIRVCISAGIREYVVCAGARNLDLVVSLHDLDQSGDAGQIRIFSHFEERAAGFFALGRVMQSGKPCAVVTTSGTAVAELLPSVIESHYQKRPLVILSADRPMCFRGSGAPQAIEQVGLFGDYVEGCDDIEWKNELTVFNGWSRQKPWHVNVCLEENERGRTSALTLGKQADERANPDVRPVLTSLKEGWKGLVVMLGGLEPDDRETVWHFLRDLGAPVLADATSGLREVLGSLSLVDGDRILKENPPAEVLRIGEVPVGRFWRDLEDLEQVNVVSISRTGYCGMARESEVITGSISRSIRAMGEVAHLGDPMDYIRVSSRRRGRIAELLESLPESEPGMIRTLSAMASTGSGLYLGNSLPIREWNDFAQREVPYEAVRANRGANGIDGQIATWLGATAGEQDAWGVFGDLTALYDLAAPALLSQVECGGRVLVVINNGGGKIFQRLPALENLGDEVSRMVTNAHGQSFEAWASMWGMHYTQVRGIEDFDFEPAAKTIMVEVVPDERQTARFWEQFAKI